MRKLFEKLKVRTKKINLNPEKPAERKKIIEEAVQRTVKEYGEALKRLGAE